MDEKTEELRDIFVDVTESETVTESQEDSHGTLLTDEGDVDERLLTVIDRIRDRFGMGTDLDDDALVAVVRGFYEGNDDEEIAAAVDATPDEVFHARADLHLLRDGDTEAPFDLSRVRDADIDELVDEFDVSAHEVRRYRRVVAAQNDIRTVSKRFQTEYEDVLTDAGIATTMTESIREDGLKEATEDIGSLEDDADVDF